jgi:hypothetical protein
MHLETLGIAEWIEAFQFYIIMGKRVKEYRYQCYNIVTHMTTATQQLGGHIPEGYTVNNRGTSLLGNNRSLDIFLQQ